MEKMKEKFHQPQVFMLGAQGVIAIPFEPKVESKQDVKLNHKSSQKPKSR
jgi:hypothetical protein